MSFMNLVGFKLSLLLLVGILPTSTLADDIWIEAETAPPDPPWVYEDKLDGHMGDGYLHWVEGSRGEGVLEYEFEIQEAGTYEVWLRGRRDQEGVCKGAAGHYCNDVFTQMNDGRTCKTMIKGGWGSWIWEARTAECHGVSAKAYELEAGLNKLTVKGRSNGIKLDVIVINRAGTERQMLPSTSTNSQIKNQNPSPNQKRIEALFDMQGKKHQVKPGITIQDFGKNHDLNKKPLIIRLENGSILQSGDIGKDDGQSK